MVHHQSGPELTEGALDLETHIVHSVLLCQAVEIEDSAPLSYETLSKTLMSPQNRITLEVRCLYWSIFMTRPSSEEDMNNRNLFEEESVHNDGVLRA